MKKKMTQFTSPFKSLRYLFLASANWQVSAIAIATIPLTTHIATAQVITKPVTASTAIAQATEQTLVLCETNNTAIRIYQKGTDTFMRAFNRQQAQVFMNDTPTELGEMPNATSYRNLLGELSVTVLANNSADDCSITISSQSAENGTLLADNRLTDSPQITPIETPADAAVTGTLSYRARIRLVPGAVVTTQLVDLTEGLTIAEQTITTTGEQVPIPFTLSYNPSDIFPGHRYVVKANIVVEDELRWTTAEDYPVITQRSPLTADVQLVMADSNKEPSIQPVPSESDSTLPSDVEQAVIAALPDSVGAAEVVVTNYSAETWPDGCLGLSSPGELCLTALTEGWRVEMLDTATNLTYVYRTNENGAAVRLESEAE